MLKKQQLRSHQRGAVLITSLIILLVMTLISVSGMRAATFEERMSANDMQYNIAFQAAESVVENVLSEGLDDSGRLSKAITNSAGTDITAADDIMNNTAIIATGSVNYLGKGPAPGSEIGDEDSFVHYFFEVSGTGEIPAVGAVRSTVNGVRVLGPDAGG